MTNVKSYEYQRNLAMLRSLSCRVVFLTDIVLQGAVFPDSDLDFEKVEEQLSAFSCALIECVHKIYLSDDD